LKLHENEGQAHSNDQEPQNNVITDFKVIKHFMRISQEVQLLAGQSMY